MSLHRVSRLSGDWTVRPIVADDILEFHAARVLLLLQHCGTRNQIKGLTKLAKLDFFVRYPAFFNRIAEAPSRDVAIADSPMVRHHYGPWDHRYYQILAFLESAGLIDVSHDESAYSVALTTVGLAAARELSKDRPFQELVSHMRSVKKHLGRKSGTALKRLIYREFDTEVTQRDLGEII